MSTSAATILEELKAAFPAKRPASIVAMSDGGPREEPMQVEVEFADKEGWTEITPEWVDNAPDGWASALSFLSDEAICFYIPAYIAADLADALERVNPHFHLIHGLDESSRFARIRPENDYTWTHSALARWRGLTQDQALAIVHYLEWKVEQDGREFSRDIIEAMDFYWYARASRLPLPCLDCGEIDTAQI